MFEKVSRSLKYDSNIFFVHRHIYIYMDTTVDHFTPLAPRVRGKKCATDSKGQEDEFSGKNKRDNRTYIST